MHTDLESMFDLTGKTAIVTGLFLRAQHVGT